MFKNRIGFRRVASLSKMERETSKPFSVINLITEFLFLHEIVFLASA